MMTMAELETVQEFAADVKNVAKRLKRDHPELLWGRKFFIEDLWDWGSFSEEREEFNQQLIKANRLGLLELTRADLVQAMDRVRVKNSEINYLGIAHFHFVTVG